MRSARLLAMVLSMAVTATAAGCSSKETPSAAPPSQVSPSEIGSQTPLVASAAPSPLGVQSAAPPAQPKPGTGKPSADNTGVPPGTALAVVTGDQTFSTPGQVITGRDFRGFVKVTTSGVIFRKCVFRGRATSNNASLLDTRKSTNTIVEDSEFVPSNPSAGIDGLWARNTSLYRVNIHGAVDGMKAESNVLLQDSYIHDMSWFASDPNQGGGPTHNDGVQSFDGDSNIILRHNTIDMSSDKRANATWQSSAANSLVENNWLDGGGCSLNFAHEGSTTLTGIKVINNRFGRKSFFGCPILISTKTVLAQNTGNVWDDTGTPIPKPEQHD